MRIEKHISELLFEHDCVSVPGFGGFVCNYSSANIHPGKHRFHPPFKKISFNRNLKNNDGLLANQIAQAENVSYSEANRFLSEWVEQLNKKLNTNKRFDLKNIGTFYLGEENTLLFDPDETINYLPDSFGFSVFHSPPIQREPIGRKIENKFKNKVIIPSKEKGEVISAKRRTARYLVASAAVLIIAFILSLSFQTGLLKNMDYSSMNPFAEKPQPRYQLTEDVLPENDISPKRVGNLPAMAKDTMQYRTMVIDGRTPIVVRMKEDATTAVKTKNKELRRKNRFHIIGGAFAVSENAERFCKKLVRQGYHASIIDKKGKKLRFVSYDGFATREQALRELDKIRRVHGDAWLMKM